MKQFEAAKLVAILMAAYPKHGGSDQTALVYESEIVDLDAELAGKAVRTLMRTCKFMPSIAEIRSAAIDVADGPKTLGVEAWGHVVDAIRRVGIYGEPVFLDALTARSVELMGWQHLCKSPNDAADRARFVELYNGLTDRERHAKAAGQITAPPPQQIGGPVAGALGAIGGRQ